MTPIKTFFIEVTEIKKYFVKYEAYSADEAIETIRGYYYKNGYINVDHEEVDFKIMEVE
jgi:hypothetical protein